MGNKLTHDKSNESPKENTIDYDSTFRLVFTHTYTNKFENEEKDFKKQVKTLKESLLDLDEVVLPLFCYLSRCTSYSQQYMTQSMFMSAALDLSTTAEEVRYKAEIEQYFMVFSERQDTLPRNPSMWISCYKASLITAGLTDELPAAPHDPIFHSILKSLYGHKEQVTSPEHTAWCKANCRGIIQDDDLKDIIIGVMSNGRIKSTTRSEGNGNECEYSNRSSLAARMYLLTPPLLWAAIMCVAREEFLFPDYGSGSAYRSVVEGSWTPLYSSKQHGLSVNGFKHRVYEYHGPTLLVISFNNIIYCLGTDMIWSAVSTKWRGNQCIVFMLLQEYRTITRDPDMVYFNLTDRSVPRGLQIAKYGGRPVIAIDDDFSTVRHYGIEFKLDGLEVWGCGGSQVREHQLKQQEWEEKETNRHKNRKLKLDDWENNPDKQLLELGGVTTEHAQR